MPYILPNRRARLDPIIDALDTELQSLGDTGGDFNYVVYKLGLRKYSRQPSYATIEEFIGTLHCCANEFYRRVADSHEDSAIEKNGDVLIR